MRLTPSQPELKGMPSVSYAYPVEKPVSRIPVPQKPLQTPYIPNSSAQLALLTLEIQSTNERLQQIMFGMEKLTQKMTLLNARLDGLR
jgi:hypothetical protein